MLAIQVDGKQGCLPHFAAKPPYEIYGRVANLSRLDVVHRSRCTLPDSAGVDRETFEGWLQLLGRASEVAEVIARFDSHPWRACKLTSRSLSLTDDVRYHFATLTEAFATVEASTRSLIEDGLLAGEITPKCLFETVKSLELSRLSPAVPQSWFGAPIAVAEAVLGRHAAQRELDDRRTAVADYDDSVLDKFPNDVAARLNDSGSCAWITRLRHALAWTVCRQRDDLTSPVATLLKVASCSQETATALATLITGLDFNGCWRMSTPTVFSESSFID